MSNVSALRDGDSFINTVRNKRDANTKTPRNSPDARTSQTTQNTKIGTTNNAKAQFRKENMKKNTDNNDTSNKQNKPREFNNKRKSMTSTTGAVQKSFQNQSMDTTETKELKALQKNLSALGTKSKSTPDTNDISAFKDVKWNTLGVRADVIDAITRAGFIYPSPVQVLSIPHAIGGEDLLVRAKNGTGKTAAFIIPIINKIDVEKGLQAIILVPIRELALQISKIFMTFGREIGIKSVPLIGGTSLTEDIMRVKAGVHVIIGTPGRVIDILGKNVATVENDPILVFDEADKLLDCSFHSSITELLNILPVKRQMLLYSATFPHSTEGFVKSRMSNPRKIKVSEQNLRNVSQYFAVVKNETKMACLKSLLLTLNIDQCIIFCSSVSNVNYLAEKITALGMSAYFMHSSMDQEEKNIVYHNFTNKKCRILVSTDVTTRGIDVPGVNVVINFCMPSSSESYLHRVGRCGRFGTSACAINLVTKEDMSLLKMYEKAIGMKISPVSDFSFKGFCKK
ncbi:ATP-dependent RNA helicase DDX6/DHH1 [Pancytospora epiphaga]|nr:ATP-dependent RNA helicase DDX6/DHH1 [Pancytospora epiphaga]